MVAVAMGREEKEDGSAFQYRYPKMIIHRWMLYVGFPRLEYCPVGKTDSPHLLDVVPSEIASRTILQEMHQGTHLIAILELMKNWLYVKLMSPAQFHHETILTLITALWWCCHPVLHKATLGVGPRLYSFAD